MRSCLALNRHTGIQELGTGGYISAFNFNASKMTIQLWGGSLSAEKVPLLGL